jgi:hypothetical protein
MRYFRNSYLLIFLIFEFNISFSQGKRVPIYDPGANAQVQLDSAISKARLEHKNVFIQIGGNWCSWCYLFHDFIENDTALDSLINNNYVTLHINYSKENYNKPVLKHLGFPQRFGFPVFVILNNVGAEIHIQDSSLLEEGHGYNREKVLNFLDNWTPEVLKPEHYN